MHLLDVRLLAGDSPEEARQALADAGVPEQRIPSLDDIAERLHSSQFQFLADRYADWRRRVDEPRLFWTPQPGLLMFFVAKRRQVRRHRRLPPCRRANRCRDSGRSTAKATACDGVPGGVAAEGS